MSISLKVLDSSKQVAEYQIEKGNLLVIQAQDGVNYQLTDNNLGFAPDNILTKRKGNNLVIFLEDGDLEADILIENYYDNDSETTNLVVGLHENGNIYAYVPESGEVAEAISMLAEEVAAPQALGGTELATAFYVFNPNWLMALLPLVGLGAAAAVLAAHGRHDKNFTETNTAIIDQTPPSAPNISTNPDGSLTITPTDDSTSEIIVTYTDEQGQSHTATASKDPNSGKWTIDDSNLTVDPESGVVTVPEDKVKDGSSVTTTAKDSAGNESSASSDVATSPDSDNDGLSNEQEREIGSDPNNDDSDNDGIKDGDEINQYKTDPTNPDTDGDGINDGTELNNNTDPLVPNQSQATVSVDNITADNIINATEALQDIPVTGLVSGDFNVGDMVTVSVNGVEYSGSVGADGKFSIPVKGTDLAADSDKAIEVKVVATKGVQPLEISVTKDYEFDETAPKAPSVVVNEDGSVAVIPDTDAQELVVNYTDEKGNPQTVETEKDPISGEWKPKDGSDLPEGVTVDPTTGKVTIPEEAVKDGSEVTASDKDKAGNESGKGTATAGSPDDDHDGLTNEQEREKGTDKDNPDTDGDGVSDGKEVNDGTDPLDKNDHHTSVELDKITDDNIINAAEKGETVPVSGRVSQDFSEGDVVTVTVNGKDYTGTVDANGKFSVDVDGADLAADPDKTIEVKVVGVDENDQPMSAENSKTYEVDTDAPAVPDVKASEDGSVTITPPADEDVVSVDVTYTDEKGVKHSATETKDPENGKWSIDDNDLSIDPESGVITIAEDKVKDGSEVTASASDDAGNRGDTGRDNAASPDDDHDGLTNEQEREKSTDKDNPDTDGDGVSDGKEVNDGTDPLDKNDHHTSVELDKITDDNVINAAEKGETVPVTGRVSQDFSEGDVVTVTVNGKDYSGTVDANGKFSVDVDGADLAADPDKTIEVKVVGVDENDQPMNAENSKTYEVDTDAPAAPDVKASEDGSVTITPPADEDVVSVDVTYTDEKGVEHSATETKDPESGKWSIDDNDLSIDPESGVITITEDKVKDGSDVTASNTDNAGNESAPTSQTALNNAGDDNTGKTATPTYSTVEAVDTEGDSKPESVTIVGKTEPNAVVEVFKNGVKVGETTADQDGNFTLDIDNSNGTLSVLDQLEMNATAPGKLTSDPADVQVPRILPATAPLITPHEGGSVTIFPQGNDIKVTIKYFNEENIEKTTVVEKDPQTGLWQISGDNTVTDAGGNTTNDPTAIEFDPTTGKVTILDSALQDVDLAGKATIVTATAGNGNRTVYDRTTTAPVKAISALEFTDISALDTSTVADTDPEEIHFTINTNEVRNTAEINTAIEIVSPTGEVYVVQNVVETKNQDGTSKIIIRESGNPGLDLQAGSVVRVTQITSDREPNTKSFTVPEALHTGTTTPEDTTPPAQPTIEPKQDGSVEVTPATDATEMTVDYTDENGQPQSVVVEKDPTSGEWKPQDGTTLPEGVTVDPTTGKVTIPEEAVQGGSEVSANNKDEAGNQPQEPATDTAVDTDAPAQPTIEPKQDGSVEVTPATDATEMTVDYTDENGQSQSVVVEKDPTSGEWKPQDGTTLPEGVTVDPITGKVTIPEEAVQGGSEVSANNKDEAGNQPQEPATDTTVDTDAPAQPTIEPKQDGSVEVTPATDATEMTVDYTDENGQPQSVVVEKDPTSGEWKPQDGTTLPEGVTVDPITGKVTIPEEAVQGGSEVSANNKDEAGNQPQEPATDTTVDTDAPAQPTIEPKQDGSVEVTPATDATEMTVDYTDENGQPQSVVVEKDPTSGEWKPQDGTTLPDGVTVDPTTGKVTIPEEAVQGGSEVSANNKDEAGNQPQEPATDTAVDTDAPAQPTIDPKQDGSVEVTPATDATEMTVDYTDENGQSQSVVVEKDPTSGEWKPQDGTTLPDGVTVDPTTGKVTIPEEAVQGGSEVSANNKDEAGNQPQEPATNTAVDTDVPAQPTIEPKQDGSVEVTPATDATEMTVDYTDENGQPQSVVVEKDPTSGEWKPQDGTTLPDGVTVDPTTGKVTIPEEAVQGGSEVSANNKDEAGNQPQEPATNTAVDTDVPAQPTIEPKQDGSVEVTPATDATEMTVDYTDENGQPQSVVVEKDPTSGEWKPQDGTTLPEGVTVDPTTGKVTIPEEAVQGGSEVSANNKDEAGNQPQEPATDTAVDTDVPAQPTIDPKQDGSVEVTPATDATEMTVDYTDENGQPQSVVVEKDPTSGEWKPQDGTTLPDGVTVDPTTGKVTIPEEAVQGGSEVSANNKDDAGNQPEDPAKANAKDTDEPVQPTIDPKQDGSVEVTPATDATEMTVDYTDENGQPQSVVVEKDPTSGEWKPQEGTTLPDGVTVDPTSGKVTIPEEAVQGGSEVSANNKDEAGNQPQEPATDTAVDTDVPAQPTIDPKQDGSVEVTPATDVTEMTVDYTDENGQPQSVVVEKDPTSGEWKPQDGTTLPDGVTVDPTTGKVTIPEEAVQGGSEVTANNKDEAGNQPEDPAKANAKDTDEPVQPTIEPKQDGSVEVTPATDATEMTVDYTDENGQPQSVVVEKDPTSGEWKPQDGTTLPDGVTVDPTTGKVTIPEEAVQGGSEVSANNKDDAGNQPQEPAKENTVDTDAPAQPTIDPKQDGSVEVTPATDATEMTVDYTDENGQPQSVVVEKDPTSGEWKPQDGTTLPDGVTVDPTTGKVTIPEEAVQGGSEVSANNKDEAGNQPQEPAKENTVDTDVPAQPTIEPKQDGSVEVTPATDATEMTVDYTDENGQPQSVVVEKDPTSGEWKPQEGTTLPDGVTVDPTTGKVTIPEEAVQGGSEVSANNKDDAGNQPEDPAKANAKDTDEPVQPTIEPKQDGSVEVTPATDATEMTVDYTDENGQPQSVVVEKDPTSGEWKPQDGTTLPDGVTVDPTTGKVTIPEEAIKTPDSEVIANNKDEAGNQNETPARDSVVAIDDPVINLDNAAAPKIKPGANNDRMVIKYYDETGEFMHNEAHDKSVAGSVERTITVTKQPDGTWAMSLASDHIQTGNVVNGYALKEVTLTDGSKATFIYDPNGNAVKEPIVFNSTTGEVSFPATEVRGGSNITTTVYRGTENVEKTTAVAIDNVDAVDAQWSGAIFNVVGDNLEINVSSARNVALEWTDKNGNTHYTYFHKTSPQGNQLNNIIDIDGDKNGALDKNTWYEYNAIHTGNGTENYKRGDDGDYVTLKEHGFDLKLTGNNSTFTIPVTELQEGSRVKAYKVNPAYTNRDMPAGESAEIAHPQIAPANDVTVTPNNDGSVIVAPGADNTKLTIKYWNEKNSDQVKGAEGVLNEEVTINEYVNAAESNNRNDVASTYKVTITENHTEEVTLELVKGTNGWTKADGSALPTGVTVENGNIRFAPNAIMGKTEISVTATNDQGGTATDTKVANVDTATTSRNVFVETINEMSTTSKEFVYSAVSNLKDYASNDRFILNTEAADQKYHQGMKYVLEYSTANGADKTVVLELQPIGDDWRWVRIDDGSNLVIGNAVDQGWAVHHDQIMLPKSISDEMAPGTDVRLWTVDSTKDGQWQLQDTYRIPKPSRHDIDVVNNNDLGSLQEYLATSTITDKDIYLDNNNTWSGGLSELQRWNGFSANQNSAYFNNNNRVINYNPGDHYAYKQGVNLYSRLGTSAERIERWTAVFQFSENSDYLVTGYSVGNLYRGVNTEEFRVKAMRFDMGAGDDVFAVGRDLGVPLSPTGNNTNGPITVNMGAGNDLIVVGAGNEQVELGWDPDNGEIHYFFKGVNGQNGVPEGYVRLDNLSDIAGSESNYAWNGGRISGNTVVNAGDGDDTLIVEGISDTTGNFAAIDNGSRVNMGAGDDAVYIAAWTSTRGSINDSIVDLGAGDDYMSMGGELLGSTVIYGGSGIDHFEWLNPGATVNFNQLRGFEHITLHGGKLDMTWQSVAQAGVQGGDLVIHGNGTLDLDNHATPTGQEVANGVTYNVYSDGNNQIYVETGVTVI